MIETNLVGQYVVQGWNDDKTYQEIVAVYFYEGDLVLLARNPDDRLHQYTADGCIVVPCNQVPAGKM